MGKTITETIGVDLGDRYSTFCVLDQRTGEERGRGRLVTTPAAFEDFFRGRTGARAVVEVGTHSPWVSRILERHCAETLVANARELHFIFRNDRKSDESDPERLARVGRMDPKLLRAVTHRSEEAQSRSGSCLRPTTRSTTSPTVRQEIPISRVTCVLSVTRVR